MRNILTRRTAVGLSHDGQVYHTKTACALMCCIMPMTDEDSDGFCLKATVDRKVDFEK